MWNSRGLGDLPHLEQEMNSTYRAEPLADIFRTVVEEQLAATASDPSNPQWHSFWFIFRKTDRTVIGSAVGLQSPPRCRRLRRDRLRAGPCVRRLRVYDRSRRSLVRLSLRQPGVRHVTAETDAGGIASQRLLRRCGFRERSRGITVRGLGNLPVRSYCREACGPVDPKRYPYAKSGNCLFWR